MRIELIKDHRVKDGFGISFGHNKLFDCGKITSLIVDGIIIGLAKGDKDINDLTQIIISVSENLKMMSPTIGHAARKSTVEYIRNQNKK